jgi:hypothetical protein
MQKTKVSPQQTPKKQKKHPKTARNPKELTKKVSPQQTPKKQRKLPKYNNNPYQAPKHALKALITLEYCPA